MFDTRSKPQHGWLRRSAFCASLLSIGAGPLLGQTAFINEIHYDNIGKDTGEAIEVAGQPGPIFPAGHWHSTMGGMAPYTVLST